MDIQGLLHGNRIDHPTYGAGTVTFAGKNYIGISFADGREELFRRHVLEMSLRGATDTAVGDIPESPTASTAWPGSTFVSESPQRRNDEAPRWTSIVGDLDEIRARRPDFFTTYLEQYGYGEAFPAPHPIPENWPRGRQLVWPERNEGFAIVVATGTGATEIAGAFPFFSAGSQQTLILRQVVVGAGEFVARVLVRYADIEFAFFDNQYVINRAWYAAGKSYDFLLAGLAYTAMPARPRRWPIRRDPEEVAWRNARRKPGQAPLLIEDFETMDGVADFGPLPGVDIDHLAFHGPARQVTEFRNWLGLDGWCVRTRVKQVDGAAMDFDIFIVRQKWQGPAAPAVGQFIEGRLWLQGRLWQPR